MKHQGLNQLLCAATVNRRFRETLLRDPAQALAMGYQGQAFHLAPAERQWVLNTKAQHLEDLAEQLYRWIAADGDRIPAGGHASSHRLPFDLELLCPGPGRALLLTGEAQKSGAKTPESKLYKEWTVDQANRSDEIQEQSTTQVLVVDDEAILLRCMELYLQEAGFDVTTASSGAAALEEMRTNVPEVVVCDLFMPEMNGLEFCQRVRRNPQWQKVRLLLLTARLEEPLRRQLSEFGIHGYLSKPFEPKALIALLENGRGPKVETLR